MLVSLLRAFATAFSFIAITASAYTGAENHEATLTFDGTVLIASSVPPTEKASREKIEAQLKFLFGPMTLSELSAVPKNDHRISEIFVDRSSEHSGKYLVRYRYTGTISVLNSAGTSYPVVLPFEPEAIFNQALEANGSENPNACTDAQDPDEQYFWYNWSPDRPGCKLTRDEQYYQVEGTLKALPSAQEIVGRETVPEYSRLVQTRDGKKIIPITLLIGTYAGNASRSPIKSKDPGAVQFDQLRNQFIGMGFSESEITRADLRNLTRAAKKRGEIPRGKWVNGYPFARKFEKETPSGTVSVRLFYGDSSEEGSSAFFVLYKDAIEHDALMIYDGHSGLGDYLSLEKIQRERRIKLVSNPEIYQIYYFNSCTSYAYYNDSYFAWKASPTDPRGTKQLDIITNGLATGYTTKDTNMVLVKAVLANAETGKITDYRTITSAIDTKNLIGVNGDADN